MKASRFVRVKAPGLPTYPPLMFYRRTRRAKVSARHATWRSYACAARLTEVVSWLLTIWLNWLWWPLVPASDMVLKVFGFIFLVPITYHVLAYLLHGSLRDCLARRVFATRTTLWFTPHWIGVQSGLYDRNVVLWRQSNSQPVRVRFLVQPDQEALSLMSGSNPRTKMPQRKLREAGILEAVVTTTNRQQPHDANNRQAIMRTIPITEVDGSFAARFTMVYTAAAELTAAAPQQQTSINRSGNDIDET